MTQLTVLHERWKCIGCGACAAVAPDFWEMSDDGYSDIKGCQRQETDEGLLESREIADEDRAQNQEAADACPVECIHLKEE